MRAVKWQCYQDLMSNLPESYERSEVLLNEAVVQDDFREGLRSWQDGRAPIFQPLPENLALIDITSQVPGSESSSKL